MSELNQLGVGVWIDEVELVIGDSLIERLGDGIEQSDFLVAVISPNSLESSWCQKELALAATQGINQKRVKVLPIRLDGVDMPVFLQDAVWGDGTLHTPEGLAAELAVAMDRHLDRRGPARLGAGGPADVAGSHSREQVTTTAASGPTELATSGRRGTHPWTIQGTGRVIPPSGRDATGFAWTLRRGEKARRVIVWISGDVMASRDAGLPRDVAQAKRTKGGSVARSLLRLESPPLEVLVSTYGIRWELAE